ncbi:MAG: hypothetical protein ACE5E4_08900 [Candidatus Binatia bacterium]
MDKAPLAEQQIAFRLPRPGWPRLVFEGDHLFEQGRLLDGDRELLRTSDREQLERGVETLLANGGPRLRLQLRMDGSLPRLCLEVDDRPALREDGLRAPTSRSAWLHAWLAAAASLAGFAASYLYLMKAQALGSEWSFKMSWHMAAWHLLLVLTLFPASVWGQRLGIRVVQTVSALFFAIHAGIALANLVSLGASEPVDPLIAMVNAISGAFFLAAALYGNRAWRDMDPCTALLGMKP